MASLNSVELSRFMHQRGMENLSMFEEFRQSHPIVALGIVHRMINMPGRREEAHYQALNVLDQRLSQPDALRIDDPTWFVRNFKRVKEHVGINVPPLSGSDHSKMWVPALEIISRPIERAEIEENKLISS